jgi:hypothetical protein
MKHYRLRFVSGLWLVWKHTGPLFHRTIRLVYEDQDQATAISVCQDLNRRDNQERAKP